MCTYNPNGAPCFDWKFGLVLEILQGWPSKIEVSWVLGIQSKKNIVYFLSTSSWTALLVLTFCFHLLFKRRESWNCGTCDTRPAHGNWDSAPDCPSHPNRSPTLRCDVHPKMRKRWNSSRTSGRIVQKNFSIKHKGDEKFLMCSTSKWTLINMILFDGK